MSSTASKQHMPWVDCDPAGPQLKIKDVAARTGLSRSQVYAMIADGGLPPLIKLGKRSSAMPSAWLDAWIRDRAAHALGAKR